MEIRSGGDNAALGFIKPQPPGFLSQLFHLREQHGAEQAKQTANEN